MDRGKLAGFAQRLRDSLEPIAHLLTLLSKKSSLPPGLANFARMNVLTTFHDPWSAAFSSGRGGDAGTGREMTAQRNDDRPRGLRARWELPGQPVPAVDPPSGERRKYPRFALCIALRLRGTKSDGAAFEETTSTEVVSAGGFGCKCLADLAKETPVDVFLLARGSEERLIGHWSCPSRGSGTLFLSLA